ncbi:MAG: CPBP family intramembrane glutamic endopeptidase [Kofleriaceae bacterium]
MYHEPVDATRATAILAGAVAVFYTTAGLLPPGLAQLAGAQLALAATIALAMRRHPRPAAALGLVAPPRRALLGALLLGGTAWYPNARLAVWVQSQLGGATRVEGIERLFDGPPLAVTALVLIALPAVCEELAFRGLWARALASRLGIAGAIAISAPVFGLFHLNSAQLLPASLLGAALAWCTLRARSLWIAIAIHALNNACAVAAGRGLLGALADVLDAWPRATLLAASALAALGAWLIGARRT